MRNLTAADHGWLFGGIGSRNSIRMKRVLEANGRKGGKGGNDIGEDKGMLLIIYLINYMILHTEYCMRSTRTV